MQHSVVKTIIGYSAALVLGALFASPATSVVAASNGAAVYQSNCAACHGATGLGTAGAFPPLAGNPMVVGDPNKVIHAVKFGLTGKVQVKGQSYDAVMRSWGGELSNADMAAVITYIRSSWGNAASPVTAAQVAAAK